MSPEHSAILEYVHGYSGHEEERLLDQASTLTGLLHHDTRYPAGARVLEAGCGVGAQTVTLAGQNFLGASAVRFNGTNATFSVLSNTTIHATVPANASATDNARSARFTTRHRPTSGR